MKNSTRIITASTLLLALTIYFGPKVDYPAIDNNPLIQKFDALSASQKVSETEKNTSGIKPDNEARIIWADSLKQTEYSVVYLHGFGASQAEGRPVHTEFAKRYGFNLYLPRLAFHGLSDPDAFQQLTPGNLIESAKEAVQIGKAIGKKVILMSCSTGSTLSVYLAANDPEVYALYMFSPNIDINDKKSMLLTGPWGKQLLKTIENGDYHSWEGSKEASKYWYLTYRNEGILALKYLINETMTDEIFSGIKQPVYLGYYYKDENHKDDVVSIDRMKYFFDKISTPADKKRIKPFEKANSHMMVSDLYSKNIPEIQSDIYQFTEEVLNIPRKY